MANLNYNTIDVVASEVQVLQTTKFTGNLVIRNESNEIVDIKNYILELTLDVFQKQIHSSNLITGNLNVEEINVLSNLLLSDFINT